ncbi:MAG TPA: lipid-binding SYLF domain-containing protein [Candidatus Eisenbacteria bacterium]|nr:lipid-binding SYLF domain-containing protein [Candidatus Eisenbacteria bacterium]
MRARESARVVSAWLLALALVPAAAGAADPGSEDREARRLDDARAVFLEIRDMPDAEVPQPLLEKCRCIAVFPGVVKGAFGIGGRRGHGVMSCRDSAGAWSAPAFLTMTGGSFGFQIGVEKADVVLFFMSERGARSLVESKFTLGAKAGVSAGPVGRSAEAATDLKLDAEIYSYGRSKGAFAGISLEGAKVAADKSANERAYGRKIEAKAILFGRLDLRRSSATGSFLETLPKRDRPE